MGFKEKVYGAYQLDWMLSHGFSIRDIFASVRKLAGEALLEPEGEVTADTVMDYVEDAFFNSEGFGGGMIFAGKKEFFDSEYHDRDYMSHLFGMMPDGRDCMDEYSDDADNEDDTGCREGAWKTTKGCISIQEMLDGGWDYTLYSPDYDLIDGGQIDDPDISMEEARDMILEDFGWDPQETEPVGFEALDDMVCEREEHGTWKVTDGYINLDMTPSGWKYAVFSAGFRKTSGGFFGDIFENPCCAHCAIQLAAELLFKHLGNEDFCGERINRDVFMKNAAGANACGAWIINGCLLRIRKEGGRWDYSLYEKLIKTEEKTLYSFYDGGILPPEEGVRDVFKARDRVIKDVFGRAYEPEAQVGYEDSADSVFSPDVSADAVPVNSAKQAAAAIAGGSSYLYNKDTGRLIAAETISGPEASEEDTGFRAKNGDWIFGLIDFTICPSKEEEIRSRYGTLEQYVLAFRSIPGSRLSKSLETVDAESFEDVLEFFSDIFNEEGFGGWSCEPSQC